VARFSRARSRAHAGDAYLSRQLLRVLLATATTATKLLKVGELEDRLAALEAAINHWAVPAETDPLGLP
jgi:hypothetical protein